MFEAVLVANRGEIAVRIIRTLERLGIRSVAVHSDADADAPHVRRASEAVRIGPAPAAESYLRIDRLLDAAAAAGADAIHPGYGFLAESAAFARACADAGLVFIGPPARAIAAMGDKIRAKRLAEEAGVAAVPGLHAPDADDAQLIAAAPQVGFPLLVKAAAGGGGRGMRAVRSADELSEALAGARREAQAAFGDDRVLLERLIARPRHIEIQVLADASGELVHLGERECSLQRRHQKIIEECPSPLLDAAAREAMGAAAVRVAQVCGYVGAGTVEFIVPGDDPERFFFLEMNTRLQVEHPITEEVYGLDLVEQQLRIAAGLPLGLAQADLQPRGHAVEARVYAEDSARGFLPTGGRVLDLVEPAGEGVRVDSGLQAGLDVTLFYDSLLAKVIARADTRDEALRRLDQALAGTAILGVLTNVGFLRRLLAHPDVATGRLDAELVEREAERLAPPAAGWTEFAAAALARVVDAEPAPGAVADPFDLPGGWRLGAPAWMTLRLAAEGVEPVEVRVRGGAAAAEVAFGSAAGEVGAGGDKRAGEPSAGEAPLRAAAMREPDGSLVVTLGGEAMRYRCSQSGSAVWLARDGWTWVLREEDRLAPRRDEAAAGGELIAPMPGTVTAVHVAQGDEVSAGQALLVVEAMKMEHPVTAPFGGTVAKLLVAAGDRVRLAQPLAVVEQAP